MKYIRTFWHVLKHSILPLDDYYKKILKTRTFFTWKYFIILIVFFTALTLFLRGISFLTTYPPKTLTLLINDLNTQFPDDLVITINDQGRLITNAEKPYIVNSPVESKPETIIVVDPQATPEDFESYSTKVLMTGRKLILDWDTYHYEYMYGPNDYIRFDKNTMTNVTSMLTKYVASYWKIFLIFFTLALIVIPVLLIVSHVIFSLVTSLIVFFTMKMLYAHKNTSYRKIFQISLHSLTAPFLLLCLSMFLGYLGMPTLLYFGVLTAFTFGATYEAYIA